MAKLFGTDLFSFIKDFIKSWYEIWWLKRSIHLTWTLKNWSSLMLLQGKAWSLRFTRLDDKMYKLIGVPWSLLATQTIVKTSSTAVRFTHHGLRTAGRHTYKPLNCHRCQQIVITNNNNNNKSLGNVHQLHWIIYWPWPWLIPCTHWWVVVVSLLLLWHLVYKCCNVTNYLQKLLSLFVGFL